MGGETMDVMLNNVKGSKIQKLEAEFCRFGEIMSVRTVGAYAFITFSNARDAHVCLNIMKDHPYYNVRLPNRTLAKKRKANQRKRSRHQRRVNQKKKKDELADINARFRSISIGELEGEVAQDKEALEGAVGGVPMTTNNERSNDMCPVCKRPLPPAMKKRHGYVRTQKGVYKSADQVWEDPKDGPRLVQAQDVTDYETIMQHPIKITKGVLIRNFPAYYLQCHIYKMCENIAHILHVEMGNSGTPSEPPYAYVFVRTASEADQLVNNLNNVLHRGNVLQAFAVEQFMDEENKAAM